MRVAVSLFVISVLSHAIIGQVAADLILINANIRTLDRSRPQAEALAVSKGRITAIGTTKRIRSQAGPQTTVLDAKGRLVIPGFNDAHVHFAAIGNQFSHIDCRDEKRKEDVLAAVASHAEMMPPGRWIMGSGLRPETMPSLEEIDNASRDHPLLMYIGNSRSALANTAALKLARVADDTGLISGDVFARVRAAVPRDYERNWTEIVETASNYASSLGVTSVQDVHSDDLGDVYLRLAEAGRLKTRVYECIGIADRQKLAARKPRSSPMMREGCVKGMAPGDEKDAARFQKEVAAADRDGLQVLIHAIGADDNSNVISAFEKTIRENGRRDRRFRIEHAHELRSSDYRRLAQNDIIASMQPYLFGYSGDDHRSLLNANIRLAIGSDASMTSFNPLMAIHAAVNAGPYSISVAEAVMAHTFGSAFAEFQDKEKGTLEIGKLADFVILSEDIFLIESVRIRNLHVVTTAVNGKIVFERTYVN